MWTLILCCSMHKNFLMQFTTISKCIHIKKILIKCVLLTFDIATYMYISVVQSGIVVSHSLWLERYLCLHRYGPGGRRGLGPCFGRHADPRPEHRGLPEDRPGWGNLPAAVWLHCAETSLVSAVNGRADSDWLSVKLDHQCQAHVGQINYFWIFLVYWIMG